MLDAAPAPFAMAGEQRVHPALVRLAVFGLRHHAFEGTGLD
jgi:hypothetical protein